MSSLVAMLVALPPALVLVAAFLLPAVEASALVGLLVPGETAVFVAGLTAHAGRLPLVAVMVVAVAGATLGDQVGFVLGRRWGPGLLDRLPRRLRDADRVERARTLVRTHGRWAVLLGRWTALLRALVPGLAGGSGMSQPVFTLCNVLGGLTWGVTVAALGYGAGAAYQQVLRTMGHAGEVAVGVVVVLLLLVLGIRRVRHRAGRSARDGVRPVASR